MSLRSGKTGVASEKIRRIRRVRKRAELEKHSAVLVARNAAAYLSMPPSLTV